jgi:hypothetical protein
MNLSNRPMSRYQERGQTIIVALIILGLLLILGSVFLGIVNRNLQTAARFEDRSVVNDLAEAGIRYAQSQLLQSELGADWRGRPTVPRSTTGDLTRDPDIFFIRPRPAENSILRFPGTGQLDLGGPDGLGPFVRVNFNNGRALVRVRYAPSDANIFNTGAGSPIRNLGSVRNYTIIEAVGRQGRIVDNDPTTFTNNTPVRFRNFGSEADLAQTLRDMASAEGQVRTSRRLRAFATIGIIESARYITNKDRVSRPAELGVPMELGAVMGSTPVNGAGELPLQLGSGAVLFQPASSAPTPDVVPGFGGLHSNADLLLHGDVRVNINRSLGDRITVDGAIQAANENSGLTVTASDASSGLWTTAAPVSLFGASVDSRNPAFTTLDGILRDGVAASDSRGFVRGVGSKAPPSVLTSDPDTGEQRYVAMTRESGEVIRTTTGSGTTAENSGRYGHGRGVYVDNFADRQIASDESRRAIGGALQSLPYDWLNPNNDQARSGWQGPFYVPVGAFLELTSDGFVITRDARAPDAQRFWRGPDGQLPNSGGAPVQRTRLRYRIGSVLIAGRPTPHLINELTPGANFDAATPIFAAGQPFNGVLLFEGNVRVRGVIPTDVQMTIVSNATVYIEGSITKGLVGNDFTASYPNGSALIAQRGARIRRPSRSALMIAARDYVALNTTQFVGASAGAALETVNADGNQPFSAIRMPADSAQGITFLAELPVDPNTGNPYASEYAEFGTGLALPTRLVLSHSKDEGSAAATFLGLQINEGMTATATYSFPRLPEDPFTVRPGAIFEDNLLANYPIDGDPLYMPMYGLGGEAYQQAPLFETVAFPIVTPTALNSGDLSRGILTGTGAEGNFSLVSTAADYTAGVALNRGTNRLRIHPMSVGGVPTNDYLLARAALAPHDVRIEASIFAENGSFFVIPGAWFNPNANDTRQAYESALPANPSAQDFVAADRSRLERFGSSPIMPFYGEPLNVRVTVIGSVSENMPPPISQQAEWQRKWAWMPRQLAAMRDMTTNRPISVPAQHVPVGFDANNSVFVPNLVVSYDPMLATGRTNGFVLSNDPDDAASPAVRVDDYGRLLPPMPRLPVSPALAYFGEVQ